jgi:hypothetical protein
VPGPGGSHRQTLPGIDRDAATTMARLVLGDDMGATPDTTDATTNLAAEDP